MLNLFTFRISGFSVSAWACERDRHHDTSGRYTLLHCGDALVLKPLRLRAWVSLGAFGAHTPCGTAAAHMCPSARCEHGALLEGVPLRNTRFAEGDLRGASTGRDLAYSPHGHGISAVPH